MYGNKQNKKQRLTLVQRLIGALAPVSQAELARRAGVGRSTINKDLKALDKRGIRLCEDQRGWLSLADDNTRDLD